SHPRDELRFFPCQPGAISGGWIPAGGAATRGASEHAFTTLYSSAGNARLEHGVSSSCTPRGRHGRVWGVAPTDPDSVIALGRGAFQHLSIPALPARPAKKRM
ncbi:hypothetical protein CYMTET_21274, partial [Cymbomonas tetramitiformis]